MCAYMNTIDFTYESYTEKPLKINARIFTGHIAHPRVKALATQSEG